MFKLELIEADGDLGIVLPDAVLAKLGLGVGDAVELDDLGDGRLLLRRPVPSEGEVG
jgi:bifunctional DNA-binding transcriptional regulator/antitoxin component of YhaV-PrlF toxin-antitoxin module